MGKIVDFYFGLGSRYSYLAATQIARLERDTGAEVIWHPLHSSVLIAAGGSDPFSGKPVSGQYDWDYRRRDAEDWAAFYGVAFREPVGRLEYPANLPAQAAHAAGRQDQTVAMCHRLFHLIFVDDREAFGTDEVLAQARDLGLDTAAFESDLAGETIESAIAQDVADARRRGAFGVPTFFVGDRTFWGNDRLVLVEAALKGAL